MSCKQTEDKSFHYSIIAALAVGIIGVLSLGAGFLSAITIQVGGLFVFYYLIVGLMMMWLISVICFPETNSDLVVAAMFVAYLIALTLGKHIGTEPDQIPWNHVVFVSITFFAMFVNSKVYPVQKEFTWG